MPKGVKHDQGKVDLSMLPWEALEEIAYVYMYGAAKYDRDNWRHVEPVDRYLHACLRHLSADLQGERRDTESNLRHWAHAAANLLMLIARTTKQEQQP